MKNIGFILYKIIKNSYIFAITGIITGFIGATLIIGSPGEIASVSSLLLIITLSAGYGIIGILLSFLFSFVMLSKGKFEADKKYLGFLSAVFLSFLMVIAGEWEIFKSYLYNPAPQKKLFMLWAMIVAVSGCFLVPVFRSLITKDSIWSYFEKWKNYLITIMIACTLFFSGYLSTKTLIRNDRYNNAFYYAKKAESPESCKVRRTAIIGIDGATWDILMPMIRKGYMPNLKKMLAKSSYGDLESIYMYSPTSWTTMSTGVLKEKHGISDFQMKRYFDGTTRAVNYHSPATLMRKVWYQMWTNYFDFENNRQSPFMSLALPAYKILDLTVGAPVEHFTKFLDQPYELIMPNSTMIKYPRFWEIIEKQGAKIGVCNWLFLDPVFRDVNGFIITGWGEVRRTALGSKPDGLLPLIQNYASEQRNFWLDSNLHPTSDPAKKYNLNDVDEKFRKLDEVALKSLEEIEISGAGIKYLLEHYPCLELFVQVFYFSDTIGHHFFKYMLPDNKCDPAELSRYGLVSGILFNRLDSILGDIDSKWNGNMMLISDHGMEKIPDDAAIPINWQGFSFKLAPLLQDLGLLFTTADGEIDWTRTRAYPVMTGGHDFGISFNLKAREEHGIVSYSELIQLRENIIKELQNIILKFNEKPLFGVVARGNLKGGEPDIILDRLAAIKYGDIKKVLESTMIIGGREIPVTTFIEDKNVSGLHGKVNPQADYVLGKRGIILISGSGIKRNNVISGMKDVDVSPTILYLAGIPAGNYMDGEVFTSMCTEEFKKTHPVERVQKFPEVYFEIKNDPSGKKEKNPKQYSMK